MTHGTWQVAYLNSYILILTIKIFTQHDGHFIECGALDGETRSNRSDFSIEIINSLDSDSES